MVFSFRPDVLSAVPTHTRTHTHTLCVYYKDIFGTYSWLKTSFIHVVVVAAAVRVSVAVTPYATC